MEFNKKLAVSISEIKLQLISGDDKEALKSLQTLHRVMCRISRNEEVIRCSYLHHEETVKEATTENRIIKGSELYPHEIELAK